MLSYRKERIDNAILFFARKHRQKTKRHLSQTFLYKYLAFFEFRYLTSAGDMPLELTYRAMERGPVPMEIYDNRGNPDYFQKVVFEPSPMENGLTRYTVKPKPGAKFDTDYFADAELEEMGNLIEMFAQGWVKAGEISEASHQAIKTWKKTYHRSKNGLMNPIEEFDRDITTVPDDELGTEELKYLMRHRMAEFAV